MRKSSLALAAGIGAGAAVVGCAAWLSAPRHDKSVLGRWEQIAEFRYAHRGLYDNTLGIPENSLAAFREARMANFGCELDVHLTKDAKLVVIHDSHLGRMCGVDALVEDLTLAECLELRLLDTGQTIPTLESVLSLYEWNRAASTQPPAPLIIELKPYRNNYTELARTCAAALDSFNVRYAVESFDPRALVWFKQNRPEVIRGQLAQNALKQQNSGLSWCERAAQTALLGNVLSRPDFIAYRLEDRDSLPARISDKVFRAHQVSWTVRSQADLLKAEAAGAVVIFEGFIPGAHSTITPLAEKN